MAAGAPAGAQVYTHLQLAADGRSVCCAAPDEFHDPTLGWRGGPVALRNGGWEPPGAQLLLSAQAAPPPGSAGLPPPARRYHVPLLTSALQKAVRRSLAPAAVRLAWQLLCQERDKALRRLPIIAVEDSYPHPQLITLSVWLMVACSKGFHLTQAAVAPLLEGVWDIAASSLRVQPPEPREGTGRQAGAAAAAQRLQPLAAALLVRCSYGGMPFDMAMLREVAGCLVRGGPAGPQPAADTEREQQRAAAVAEALAAPPQLEPAHRLPWGVDGHCFRGLPERVARSAQEQGLPWASEGKVKQLWWTYRSGVYEGKRRVDQQGAPLPEGSEGRSEGDDALWAALSPILEAAVAAGQYWSIAPLPPTSAPAGNAAPAGRPSAGAKRRAARAPEPRARRSVMDMLNAKAVSPVMAPADGRGSPPTAPARLRPQSPTDVIVLSD
eukprot:TRINITY_DN50587_c0_g1_i1.p1 TRINITY_DN50587_c0_g1~~TRINITY_DN50587_c0_g1_i1.p1  ORF type:complete len:439 (+),score=102.16 TRINITY_DN50587_c0_g1_i1:102-1418(+)